VHRPTSNVQRIASIDVGTNTAQLLVADWDGGRLVPVHAVERFVRLGEGVDAQGRIGEAARERLLEALSAYAAAAEARGAECTVVGATSAMRDAANRDAVMQAVTDATGLTVELLSGEEEAAWSYVATRSAFPDLEGRVAVMDIGGGSTEFVVGDRPVADALAAGASPTDGIVYRRSLDLGCIRLTERCFASQPPAPASVSHAEAVIDAAYAAAELPLGPDVPLLGPAGTLSALALAVRGPTSTWDGLTEADRTLDAATVHFWRRRVLDATVEEVLSLHPDAMAHRADVFPVGVLLLDVLMRRHVLPAVRVSRRDLRYGLALRALLR
jgi:exopolyphosphatase/guanosine-5'-triphosphate,3'-diphosphate pyrophosphatase